MNPLTLTCVRNGHTYLFRYAPGDLSGLTAALARAAEDPQNPLDHFDAAILFYQAQQREQRQHQEAAQPT